MKIESLALTEEQKDEIFHQYSLLKQEVLSKREHGEDGYSPRNDFQRDYARVLYSPSFRRLQGKMQIVGVKSSAFYRNRLTHSLEVSQIATNIALLLAVSVGKVNEMYTDDIHLIEAAALAHDIGHPAFGHKGERVLNNIATNRGIHFEGNAQNFRVLRTLEKKEQGHGGLNLTNRTLLAINKYNVCESKGIEKFMFSPDFDYLKEVRKEAKLESARTLDVQIIELADDIAYAVHDLEDGLSLRNFTIDELLFTLKKKNVDDHSLFQNLMEIAKDNSHAMEAENVQEYSKLFRMALTSVLTNAFVNDITIGEITTEQAIEHGTSEGNQELMLNKYKSLLKNLKTSVFECTTRDNAVRLYEARGEVVLKSLFSLYTDEKLDEDGKLMPPVFRTKKKWSACKDDSSKKEEYRKELAQNAIDYIAGMMDTFAIEEYEKFFNCKFSQINLIQDKK